ncbi:GntP family permease [Ruminococcaceae bacterium OttesenSCG-928-O06]|nr:GntP family permease [Ruminococcaceae bacterium OttesenSCG-928-O06]
MDPGLLSFIGILVGLAALMFFAFKGVPMLVLAPTCGVIIGLFSGTGVWPTLSEFFMPGFATFTRNFFLLLMMSAIFGKFMEESGAARNIAIGILKLAYKFPQKYQKTAACFAMSMISAVLTYGGISLFVVTFTTVAIGRTIYEKMDVPWGFTLAGALGSATFTMTMLPGSPQLTNLVAIPYLGTTPMAGPILGIIASVIMVAMGLWYYQFALKRYEKKGEGFLPTGAEIIKVMPAQELDLSPGGGGKLLLSLVPSVVMLLLMNLPFLKWEPTLCLVVATLVCYLVFFPEFKGKSLKAIITAGNNNAMLAVANTSAVLGFGQVVANVAGFQFIVGALEHVPGPPIVQMLVAVEIAAGITGSSSGGLGIAMGALAERFLNMGIHPQAIHRLGAIAAGGLDSLPHTTGLMTSLSASRLTHSQGYIHMFVISVVMPIIVVTIVAIIHVTTGIL